MSGMLFRVQYRHEPSGEIARTYPMSRDDAVEIARQFIADGEKDVLIETPDGQTFSVNAL